MLKEFIGQSSVKRNLELLINAAKNGRPIPHIGLFGPTGIGKTTLANLFGKEIDAAAIININGQAIINPTNLRNIIAPSLKNYDINKKYIIIIDEAHALDEKIQTLLLTVLEKPAILSTPIQKAIKLPTGKTLKKGDILREKLPESTIFIFCTTDKSSLLDTLCNRLHSIYLDDYSLDEKSSIVKNLLIKENLTIENNALLVMSGSAKNIRHLIKLTERLIDYWSNKKSNVIQLSDIYELFNILGIDEYGRDKNDKKYIEYLINVGTASITNIAQYLNMSSKDVLEKVEPFLIRNNWVTITKRGRELSESALALFYKEQKIKQDTITDILFDKNL